MGINFYPCKVLMKSFTCKKPFWVNFRKYLLQYPPQLNCRNKERPGCKIGGNNFLSSNKIRIGRGTRRRYDNCRRNHSPLRQRKLESDAELVAATTTAGETIFLCCNKIRIGREPRCSHNRRRRNHSSLQRRKLESDTEDRSCNGHCRRNHSPSRQRRIESDADFVAATT